MNRTNSVEPVFSQPLSINYHQLLQTKTKIEDELYQTQRQLRKKDGEYQKKIAVYEQKIEQLEQQLEEFKERESTTKSMYDKILFALNSLDIQSYQMDANKVQEILQQICKSQSSQFDANKNKQQDIANKIQVETLEMGLQHLNDSYNKLKQSFLHKEKNCQQLQIELFTTKEKGQQSIDQLQFQLKQTDDELLQLQKTLIDKESSLRKQHKEEMSQLNDLHKQEKIILDNKVKDLEQVIAKKTKQEQLVALDKSFQKENIELKQLIERMKREKEKEDDNWGKERDQMQQQLLLQEQIINKIKKQMNTNLSNNNDATKRLKQKLQDCEKQIQMKQEEIQKLKNKIQILKQQTIKAEVLERKNTHFTNTSQLFKENTLTRALENGRDSNLHFADTSQISELTKKKSTGGIPTRTSKTKIFGSDFSINNNLQSQTRNSNSQSQQSIAFKEHQNHIINSRSQTPNSKQRKQLDKQINQHISIGQAISKQRSRRKLDETCIQQNHKNNRDLIKYLNTNQITNEEIEEEASYSPAIEKEGQRVLYTSLEIEAVVRNMIDQVRNETPLENYTDQFVNILTEQNSCYQSPNMSFSHQTKYVANQNKPNQYQYNKQNCFFMDKDFLAKLELSLKKLTQSNEKIKQIMKEKEQCIKKCHKLKQKLSDLKDEKNCLQQERDNLLLQNQKIECKLKQAQVILNLENDNSQNIGNATICDISDVSTIRKPRLYEVRDNSINSQNKLMLTLTQDKSTNSLFKNPPMSCRVNESYDVSLKMNQELMQTHSQQKQNFYQTLDKSLLDQSNITIKRNEQPVNTTQQISQAMFAHNQQSKYPSYYRGKTPTLQINLAYNQDPQVQWISNEQDDDSSILTSRNISKSSTNLGYMQSQQKSQIKYQTFRDSQNQAFRSPQMNKINYNQNNFNSLRERSPKENYNGSSMLKRIHSLKGKERYYNRRTTQDDNKNQYLAKNMSLQDIYQEEEENDEIIDIQTFKENYTKHENQSKLKEKSRYEKDKEINSPSDEKNEEEESVQLKAVNNSNFIPSMHARYIGEEVSGMK